MTRTTLRLTTYVMRAGLPKLDPPHNKTTTSPSSSARSDRPSSLHVQIGFGQEKRLAINAEILNGQTNFRDGFTAMINSIAERHPFEYVVQWLTDRIELDPGFKTFFEW